MVQLAMFLTAAQFSWCNFRVESIPPDYVLPIWPTEQYPNGQKAALLSDLWAMRRSFGDPGLLVFDPDVAADPDDLDAMGEAVYDTPADVHTGMVKLWAHSTGRDDWIWSHRGGTIGAPIASQDEAAPVSYFATGFLWLPERLLDLAFPVFRWWTWLELDVRLPELAMEAGIPAHVVSGCRPKHLHFTKEHDGATRARQAGITPPAPPAAP